MSDPGVVILLSTYNGERYLRQQLDSLYLQTMQNFRIFIRDDGSTDTSVNIIKQYAAKHANITLSEGQNIGVVKSFFELLKTSPSHPQQFYAFCDQDDVWMPDKLGAATQLLMASNNPATSLYCSRLTIADSRLQPLGLSKMPTHVGFENALVENTAIGCTQVFGETIKKLILNADPSHMMMHDWWSYLVASAFGEIIYDHEPRIYYRQHSHNVVGWDKNFASLLKKSTTFLDNLILKKNGLESLNQAKHFLNTYPYFSTEKQALLNHLLQLRHSGNLSGRYRFMSQHDVKRNHQLENLILMLTVLACLH